MRNGICWALAFLVLAAPASACVVSGTSTVEHGTGEFQGFWKYTITFSWQVEKHSLSHASVFVSLLGLECLCQDDLFGFDDPAGHTTGEGDDGTCEIDYSGEYVCKGDNSLPDEYSDVPAVKFEPIGDPCDVGTSGTGTYVFYSQMAPGAPTQHADVLAIKHNQLTCTGHLQGQLPASDCALATGESSWGAVKGQFEE